MGAKTYEEYLTNKKKREEEERKNSKSSIGVSSANTYENYLLRQDISSGKLSKDTDALNIALDAMMSGWQDSATMERNRSDLNSMVNRLNSVKNYVSSNNNSKDVASYIKQIDSLSNSYTKILDSFDSYTTEYGKYKTADDYKKALADSKAYAEEQEKLKTTDLKMLKTELDDIDSRLAAAKSEKDAYVKNYRDIGGYIPSPTNATRAAPSNAKGYQEYLSKVTEYDNLIGELESERSQKGRFYNRAKLTQELPELEAVQTESEFKKYAKEGYNTENPNYENAKGSSVFGFKFGGEDVSNKVEFIRKNKDKFMASSAQGMMSGVSPEIVNGLGDFDGKWVNLILNMTDEEANIYDYYIGKGEDKKADEYLKSLEERLSGRIAQSNLSAMENKTALELAFGLVAGLDQFGSGINNAFRTNEDYIAANSIQQTSAMVRDDLANDGPSLPKWMGGASIGQAGYDAITTAANMLPSIGASMVAGTINPALGRVVGSTLMGVSAGGNAYQEMLNLGYDKKQAKAYGVLSGLSETMLQELMGGIPGLRGVLTDKGIEAFAKGLNNGIAKAAIGFVGNMYAEGMEEFLQSVLEPYFKAFVSGEERDAIDWEEAIYSGLLGALSSAVMGGAEAGISRYSRNSSYKDTFSSSQKELVEQGLESANGTKSKSLALKYNEKIQKGKNLSGNQLGKLAIANEQAIIEEDISTIKKAVASRLSDLGETGNIDLISSAIAKTIATKSVTNANMFFGSDDAINAEITKEENNALSDSKYAQRVFNELDVNNIKSGNYTSSWAENLNTSRINPDTYSTSEEAVEETATKLDNSAQILRETALRKSESVIGDNTSLEAKKAVNGENDAIIAADIDNVVDEEIDDTSDEALNTALNTEVDIEIDSPSLQVIKSEYDKSMPAAKFVKGMVEGFKYGLSGLPKDAISNTGLYYPSLSEAQKDHAYRLGAAASKANAENRTSEIIKGKNGKTGRRKGSVKGEGVTISDLKKTFNDTQNKAYKVLSSVAEATGIDVVLYKSTINESGEFEGNQGKFKYKDNTIYIDINAGLLKEMDASDLGKYAMLRTFNHEFVHFIEKWSPEEYNSFRTLVLDELTKRGENVNDLIESKMAADSDLSYDKASREVVAEAMTDMLPDSKFIQHIAESEPNVFKRLLEKLKEFVNDIKDYFNSIGYNRSREANALKEERDGQIRYLESIVEAFDKVAENAVSNYQSNFAVDEEVKPEVKGTEVKSTETEKSVSDDTKTSKEVKKPKITTSDNGYTITDNTEQRLIEIRFDEKPSREIRDILKSNYFWFNRKSSAWQRNGNWYSKNDVETVIEALDNVYKAESKPVETQPVASEVNTAPKVSDTKTDSPAEISSRNKVGDYIRVSDGTIGQVTKVYDGGNGSTWYEATSIDGTSFSVPEYNTSDYTSQHNDINGFIDTIPSKAQKTKARNKLNDSEYKFINDLANNPNTYSEAVERTKKFRNEEKIITEYRVYGVEESDERAYKSLNKVEYDFYNYLKNKNTEVLENVKENGRQETSREAIRQDNDGAVLQSDTNGEGASRLLDEVQTEDVRGNVSERNSVENSKERGQQTRRNGDRPHAERTGRAGSKGNSEVGDLRRNEDVLSEEVTNAKSEELHNNVEEEIERKSTETPKGKNFVIGESLDLPAGEKSRFRANVDAIKLVKQLETEGRFATPAEQEVLSKYVGWGGLSNAFGEMKYNRETRKSEMVAKSGWENEFSELRKLVDDGIVTEDEYKEASASTKNAHYTSIEVIKAMYGGLEQLGFNGGRMLEPSSGVGNFVGAMPVNMSSKVNSWTMVELDSITGLIAKYLYPNADVRIQGFETANIPDNYMDVAIGNVPFGNYGVVDRAYPKRVTKAIHNYFFAKTLDKVRPGGIVMFITSSFTMNGKDTEIRQYIMDRADLLGAVRLPNNAFSGNAGTEVITDILILKKRKPGTEYAGEKFLEAPAQQIDKNYWQTVNINEYFTEHPEMVLGTPALERGMYGASSLTYNPLEGNLGEQIRNAFKNIKVKMDYPAKVAPEKINFNVQRADKKTKQSGLVVNADGTISQNQNGQLVKYNADAATAKRIAGLLSIRDAYKTLVSYLQQGQAENLIKKARKDLNAAYDKFVKEHGYINAPKNRAAIAEDPDRYSIFSLENYDAKKKTATKADIFTKNTITANRTVTHVDDIEAGVIVSINTTGGVDASLIAKLTNKTTEDVTRELIESRLAFKTKSGELEAPEMYLSGNVRAKLREAEALAPIDPDFKNNVEELKKVIPADIPFNDIYVTPGSPWIPAEVYADFIAEMLGGYNNPNSFSGPDVTVGRSNQTGDFKIVINNKRLKARYQNTQQWGTKRRTFLDLITAMMSSASLTVNDYIEDDNGRKKAVINKVETAAAQAKAEEIAKEFQEWIWRDENRRKELTSLYNETYNALVNPKFNGSHLTVNGLNPSFTLREHQANAVQRIIASGGNTLLAHKVGAGKTLEMAAAAMKLRELGIVKKPVFVVPKSLVAQWGVEFKSYFPASKLLVADEKSFSKSNRKVFSNTIANGDFDAVIVSYEQFEKIPMSDAYKKRFYEEQISDILAAIAEEKAETKGKGITVKEMEKKKAQLEKKIAELTKKEKDEDNIDFEQLGIDSIFVDEAHNFKNLQYVSRMKNISGLGNTDGSQRAFDLYTKIRYLQGLNGGRGIVFATATPVMNSMAEMYIMQKYLQSDMLNQLGLSTFDAWAKQFGEVVNAVEIKPSGQGFRVKQTFSNFRNLNELQLLFRSFADVLTQVPGLKIPKMKGGKVQTVVCEPGQFQKDYMIELEKRADNIKNVDPKEDNMLKITSDGRKVAYTQRMIDPSLPYEPGCKIYKCCDNVLEEYKNSKAIRGTQVIFCDMATPKGASKTAKAEPETVDDIELDTDSAKLYDDMRGYLVKKGIPAKEIAFIHEANTDAKKKQLFADVNEGKVRVLIGSTGKMGVGMNAQKRIVAIHHLDAPWRPGDVEQRDGRAFRQKNMNEEVTKYTYVTEGSFDARLWDILDRKQHFISQIMNGEDVGRTAEDTGDVTLSAAEVKALASGNPLIMEQVQLTNDLQKLEDLQRAYKSSIVTAKTRMLDDTQKISTITKAIEKIKEDIKARKDTYSENTFSMTIDGLKYTDKKEAGTLLLAAIKSKAVEGKYVTVGSFAGFELRVIKQGVEYSGLIFGKQGYKFNVYLTNTTHMINNLCAIVEGLENTSKAWSAQLEELKTDLAAQEKMISQPFSKQAELEEKRSRFNEIMAILNPPEEQQVSDVDEDVKDQAQTRAYLTDDISFQSRTNTLTDREILEIASNEIDTSNFSEGEKSALDIFQKRLGKLQDLQKERVEQGRLYKEQQFGANVDRAAAAETLNRMHILDNQIKTASNELLSVEEKEVLKRVLKKSRSVIEKAEREHGKELLDRWRERRRDTDKIKKYRQKIKADVDELTMWVLKPDNKNVLKHIPDALKNTVIPFITSIDFTSKRQLKGGEATKADKDFLNQLTKLRAAMKNNIDINGMYSGYNDLPPDFMDKLQRFIDATQLYVNNNSGEFIINKMTGAELKELSKIVRTLKNFIMQMNKFHANAMYNHVSEAADNTMATLRSIGNAGKKVGEASNFLLWQQMRPAYAFERFGEGGKSIYDELRRAQATLAFNSKQIIDFSKATYTDAEVKAWEKEYKTFNLGGDEVRIPVSFIMSFYELSKQPDSLRHILGEGIRVATYKDNKVKISDNGHKLTQEDINDIISSLTDRQKEVADKLQKYMATQGAKWGNHVSVRRFGEELFTNPQYFPINSDGRHLDSLAEEHPSNASLYALLNMSFTKQRNEEAYNRIILYSIFDVFANHMASMAQYNAFALPVLDALKWFNYKETAIDKETGKKVRLGSIREEMSRVYGVPEESRPGSGREGYAETFVKNIIRAYNGTETQGISTDTAGIKALRRYNMAQIAYNFRVVVQQPLAITRAGLLVDYKSILKGLKLSPSAIRANINEMHKYSGIAAWKSLGFYDINISRGLTDVIKHNNSALEKIGEVGMAGAEKADEVTWSAIWSACKIEVSRKQGIPYGSDKFFEEVTKLFEDVIYKTQVVDSVLTKTEFMRSKGFFSRAISSFMSEPATTASIAIDVYDKYRTDIQRGMSRQQAFLKNKNMIARTTAVYSISAIILAAVQATIDAARSDDDDENYLEKYLSEFTGNVIDELMPFNKLPIFSDFYDIAKELVSIFGVDTYGNPPQTIIAQWYDSLIKGTEILYKKISGGNTGYTWYAGIFKMLQAVSGMSGLPIAALTREVVSAWNNTVGVLNDNLKVDNYEKKTK